MEFSYLFEEGHSNLNFGKGMQCPPTPYSYEKHTFIIIVMHSGLVEVDVLEQLELETGKTIPELFDWVVATSTGAIIILSMLYGMLV